VPERGGISNPWSGGVPLRVHEFLSILDVGLVLIVIRAAEMNVVLRRQTAPARRLDVVILNPPSRVAAAAIGADKRAAAVVAVPHHAANAGRNVPIVFGRPQFFLRPIGLRGNALELVLAEGERHFAQQRIPIAWFDAVACQLCAPLERFDRVVTQLCAKQRHIVRNWLKRARRWHGRRHGWDIFSNGRYRRGCRWLADRSKPFLLHLDRPNRDDQLFDVSL